MLLGYKHKTLSNNITNTFVHPNTTTLSLLSWVKLVSVDVSVERSTELRVVGSSA